MSRYTTRAVALVILFSVGCGGKLEPASPDTGARAAAETFYGGLIANDPARAYATLDPESKRRVSAEQFADLTRAYLKNVGFTVEKVNVKASEEQGDAATFHATLTGHAAGHPQRYSDGITLRRRDGQWGVVLPSNFAHKTR